MSKRPTKPEPATPAALIGTAHAAPPASELARECVIQRVANGYIVAASQTGYMSSHRTVDTTFAAAMAAITHAMAPPPKAPKPVRTR